MAAITFPRTIKVVHLMAAGIWLGALTSILVLELGARGGRAEVGVQLAVYQLHEVALFWAFGVTLATGLLFSLLTPWGFARHWWIVAKWGLALALFAVTLFVQSPVVAAVGGMADAGVTELGALRYADYQARCLHLAAAQTAIVLLVFALSTYKPWGKVHREFRVSPRLVRWGVLGAGALGLAAGVFNAIQLHHFRTLEVDARPFGALRDGTYPGRARCGVDYGVVAEVTGGRLTELRVTENRTTHYARLAEAVTARIVTAQRAEVDAITGATTSSRCLMAATAHALAPARAQ